MIRLVQLVRRQPHLSLDDFQQRWRDGHGPLVAAHQTRLGIERYSQAHRLDDPLNALMIGPRGEMEEPYDGVTEVWWDSEQAFAEPREGAAGKRAAAEILADEAEFIDLPASPLWLAHEYPQFSDTLDQVVARPLGSTVKAHFPLRHRADLTLHEAQRYWHTVHGPLARRMAPALGMARYQQVHRFETALEAGLRGERGTAVETYTGHAEMWFDGSTPRTGLAVAEMRDRAVADERQFIDFRRSAVWIGKEHVFVDRW